MRKKTPKSPKGELKDDSVERPATITEQVIRDLDVLTKRLRPLDPVSLHDLQSLLDTPAVHSSTDDSALEGERAVAASDLLRTLIGQVPSAEHRNKIASAMFAAEPMYENLTITGVDGRLSLLARKHGVTSTQYYGQRPHVLTEIAFRLLHPAKMTAAPSHEPNTGMDLMSTGSISPDEIYFATALLFIFPSRT